MKKRAFIILKLLRPRQWIKNFTIFASITFAGELFNFVIMQRAILAFLIFCGLSSAIYIINDMFDIKKDKLHPFKRFRPLAHGDLSLRFAFFLTVTMILLSLWLSVFVNTAFLLMGIVYLLLQFSYSALLKNIAVIDILAIASGYILRVYAGEFATPVAIPLELIETKVFQTGVVHATYRKATT